MKSLVLAGHVIPIRRLQDLNSIATATRHYALLISNNGQVLYQLNIGITQHGCVQLAAAMERFLETANKADKLEINIKKLKESFGEYAKFFVDSNRQRVIEASAPDRNFDDELGAIIALVGGYIPNGWPQAIPGFVRAHVFSALRKQDSHLERSVLLESEIAVAREALERVADEYSKFKKGLGHRYIKLYRDVVNKRDRFVNEFSDIEIKMNKSLDKHQSTMTSIEDQFRERMKLQAPVIYFQEKSKTHFKWIMGISGAIILLLGISILLITNLTIATNSVLVSVQSLRKGGVVVSEAVVSSLMIASVVGLGTIGFFLIRNLSRILFSQITLMSQSQEKYTIIQTFLALSIDNSVSQEDRSILLAQIFRIASDGINQDDGGVDPSIMALLAKAASPK